MTEHSSRRDPRIRKAVAWLVGPLLIAACSSEPEGGTSGSLEMYESSQNPPAPAAVADDATNPEESRGAVSPADSTSSQPTDPPPSDQPPRSDLPTDEECRAFCADWVRVHVDNDAMAAYQLLDWDRFYERALDGVDVTPSLKDQFIQQRKSAMQSSDGIQKYIARGIKQGGVFQFTTFREKDGAKVAVFRQLLPNDGGVDYQIVELTRRADGKIRAVDIFTFGRGLKYSQEVRLLLGDLLASAGHMLPGMSDTVFRATIQLRRLIDNEKQVAAVQQYAAMPDVVRMNRRCMAMMIEACRPLGTDLYAQAIERFCSRFNDDPAVDMMNVELGIIRRNSHKLIAAADKIEQSIGPDSYLELLKAFALGEEGKGEEAERIVAAALSAEPTLKSGYRMQLGVLAKRSGFKEMVHSLNECEKNCGKLDDAVAWLKAPGMEAFRASGEFSAWAADRPGFADLRRK